MGRAEIPPLDDIMRRPAPGSPVTAKGLSSALPPATPTFTSPVSVQSGGGCFAEAAAALIRMAASPVVRDAGVRAAVLSNVGSLLVAEAQMASAAVSAAALLEQGQGEAAVEILTAGSHDSETLSVPRSPTAPVYFSATEPVAASEEKVHWRALGTLSWQELVVALTASQCAPSDVKLFSDKQVSFLDPGTLAWRRADFDIAMHREIFLSCPHIYIFASSISGQWPPIRNDVRRRL